MNDNRDGCALSRGVLAKIVTSIRGLVLPSPASYYAVHQERVRQQKDQLVAFDVRLEEIRKRAFCAGVRLMSIRKRPEPPRPVQQEFAGGGAS